jgi:hypothetical protein
MRAVGGILLGLAAGISASGCAGPPPPVQTAAAALPVTAYDGRYDMRLSVAGASVGMRKEDCATTPRLPVQVTNGRFNLPLAHPAAESTPSLREEATPVYQASIAPDGRINGISTDTNTLLTGQVSAGRMTGQINGLLCYYDFIADRV